MSDFFGPGSLGCGMFRYGGPGGSDVLVKSQTKSPTLFAQTDWGLASWNNLSNAASTNGSYASVTGVDSNGTNGFRLYGYGFTIPNGALVAGVELPRRCHSTGGNITDYGVNIVNGDPDGDGVWSDDRSTTTPWPTVDTTMTYGSNFDQFNMQELMAPADVNSDDFGFLLQCKCDTGTDDAYIDSANATVYYVESGDWTSSTRTCGTGTNSGTLTPFSDLSSHVAFTNPGNITANDSSFATVTFLQDDDGNSQYLIVKNFGFNIDPAKTILGVQFIIPFEQTGSGGINRLTVKPVVGGEGQLTRAGNANEWVVTDSTLTGLADGTYTTGYPGSLMDLTILPADVNSPDFGCAITLQRLFNASEGNITGKINYVECKIYYG